MSATAIRPRLLNTQDAASYLSLSPSYLRALVYRGEIRPAFRLTKLWRFDIIDLDAWIERQKGQAL